MKKYVATFWRGNPQFPDGGYQCQRTYEVKNITEARKRIRNEIEGTVYGSMELLDFQLVKGD